LVSVLTGTKSEIRYELTEKLHHHFLCRNCGEIIDIDIDCPYCQTMMIGNHKVEEIIGYFKGICEKCFAKEAEASANNESNTKEE
jgi:Fur family transcriptional regulator, peroxide stress response regulator